MAGHGPRQPGMDHACRAWTTSAGAATDPATSPCPPPSDGHGIGAGARSAEPVIGRGQPSGRRVRPWAGSRRRRSAATPATSPTPSTSSTAGRRRTGRPSRRRPGGRVRLRAHQRRLGHRLPLRRRRPPAHRHPHRRLSRPAHRGGRRAHRHGRALRPDPSRVEPGAWPIVALAEGKERRRRRRASAPQGTEATAPPPLDALPAEFKRPPARLPVAAGHRRRRLDGKPGHRRRRRPSPATW